MTLDGESEQRMSMQEQTMRMIETFDKVQADELKAFVANELPNPTAMHPGLSKFRSILAARTNQFLQLPELESQLEYLSESLAHSHACPMAWIAFASAVSCHLSKSGTFPSAGRDIFVAEGSLGSICSLRAKYVLIGLRDLYSMRVLKLPGDSARLLQDMLNAVDGIELAPQHLIMASQDFAAAIAGFDSVPLRVYNWGLGVEGFWASLCVRTR